MTRATRTWIEKTNFSCQGKRENQRAFYPAVFSYEPKQEIAVAFPDLDVATCGADQADAFYSARELLKLTLYGLREEKLPFPASASLIAAVTENNERTVLVGLSL